MVGLSVFRPISYETLVRTQRVAPEASLVAQATERVESRTSYSGFGQPVAPNADLDRLELRDDLRFLNRLPQSRKPDLDDATRRDLAFRPARIKLRLILRDWPPEWGAPEAFRAWVERGAADPVPAGLEAAAELFRSGQEERS